MKFKNIFKELKEPEKPAEDWLKEHGVFVENKKSIRTSKTFKIRLIAILTVVMLCLAVVLPFALIRPRSPGGNGPEIPKAERFRATDIGTKPLSDKSAIEDSNKLLFLDTNHILTYFGETSIIMQFVNEADTSDKRFYEESSRVVGYFFFKCMVISSSGNCFLINYQIRVCDLFDFVNISDYENLNELGEFSNTKVFYGTDNIQIEGQSTDVAYVTFNYEDVDYYLEINAGGSSYVHEEEVLETLLRDLLGVA